MSNAFRFINFEELDYINLSEGLEAAGSTGPTGPLTGSIGPTGATGSVGNAGPIGAAGIVTTAQYVNYNASVANNNFMQFFSSTSTSEAATRGIMATAGQFVSLGVYLRTVPTNPFTFTLRINGVDTALSVTSATSGFASASATVPFSVNDLFTIRTTTSSGTVSASVALGYIVV